MCVFGLILMPRVGLWIEMIKVLIFSVFVQLSVEHDIF